MPYFHIEMNYNSSTQYVVTAPNKKAAEDLLLFAKINGKYDAKKIIELRTGSNVVINVNETDKTAWADACKRKKETK